MVSIEVRADRLIAEQRFGEALDLIESEGPNSTTLSDITACRIAALCGLGRWTDVVNLGTQSIESAGDDAPRAARARVHSLLGNAFLRLGELALSEAHLRAAVHIFTWDLQSPVRALRPTRILSAVFSNMGMWSMARHELLRAIQVADTGGATRESIGLGINLAVVQLKSGAIEDVRRTIASITPHLTSSASSKQQQLCSLLDARCLRMTGDNKKASALLFDLLPAIKDNGRRREEALCQEYLGDCYVAQRQHKQALSHYQDAMRIAEETAPRGDLVPELCHRLAEANVHLGDANQAILLCERGLRVAREICDRYEECATYRVLA